VVACEDAPAVEGEAVSTGEGLITVLEYASLGMTEEGRSQQNENRPIRGGYGIVAQLKKACASQDSRVAQREKRHYYPHPICRKKYIIT
jgi:hypothetical protein